MLNKKELLESAFTFYCRTIKTGEVFGRASWATYAGMTEAQAIKIITKSFGTWSEVRRLVELRVIAEEIIAPTRDDLDVKRFRKKTDKSRVQRVIVTAAMPESELDRNAWNCLENYAERNKAQIIVLAMRGMHHSHKRYSEDLYNIAKGHFAVEHELSSNLLAKDVKLYPAHRNPAYGNRDLAKDRSLIIAHTKQDQAPCPALDPEKPRTIYTTGVITTRDFNETASGFRNAQELVKGAVAVDIDKKTGEFFARHCQFTDNGLSDMGYTYKPSGVVEKDPAMHLKMGDVHSLFTEPQYKAASIDQINYFDVPEVSAGDWFDGKSISHYESGNMIERSELLTLEHELNYLIKDVEDWLSKTKCKLGMTASNHPEWIKRYLLSNRWTTDPVNYRLGLELTNAAVQGYDPIEYYFKQNAPELLTRINFYKRSDFLREQGWLYTIHGDLGPDGARGSIHNQAAAGQVLMEHIHGPGKRGKVMAVGTLALKTLQYAAYRLSSWQAQNIIVFKSGTAQQLWMSKTGRWKID